MKNNITNALMDFTSRYRQAWKTYYNDEPFSELLHAVSSPCIIETKQLRVYWQPVAMAQQHKLKQVEETLFLTLREEISLFYTSQYAPPMNAQFQHYHLQLIQLWNDDDFSFLQKNIIGHLQSLYQRKRSPTVFIATLDNEDYRLISICNLTGHILLEELIEGHYTLLAHSLEEFLQQLIPKVP